MASGQRTYHLPLIKHLTLSMPNFRRHLSSFFFFFFFNKLSLAKKFICKVDRPIVKQRRSR